MRPGFAFLKLVFELSFSRKDNHYQYDSQEEKHHLIDLMMEVPQEFDDLLHSMLG